MFSRQRAAAPTDSPRTPPTPPHPIPPDTIKPPHTAETTNIPNPRLHDQARFDSEAAALAATEQVSAEAMVKLLSPGNLAVLEAIQRHRPGSVRELAGLTGRKEASFSRTLKRFAALRIVGFSDGPGRTRGPSLVARRVRLEIDLTGAGSAVAVEG